MTAEYKEHPIWDRKLNKADKAQIQKLMEMNPDIDYLLAETIVLMPPEKFKEICDKHKAEKKEPEQARILTEAECHTGHVFTDEEQAEAEAARAIIDKERNGKWEKMAKEKEEEEKDKKV